MHILEVEAAAAEAAVRVGISHKEGTQWNPVRLGAELQRAEVFDPGILDIYLRLRELRNKAVHGPEVSFVPLLPVSSSEKAEGGGVPPACKRQPTAAVTSAFTEVEMVISFRCALRRCFVIHKQLRVFSTTAFHSSPDRMTSDTRPPSAAAHGPIRYTPFVPSFSAGAKQVR